VVVCVGPVFLGAFVCFVVFVFGRVFGLWVWFEKQE